MKRHVHVQRCRCTKVHECKLCACKGVQIYAKLCMCVCVNVSDKKGRDKSVLLLYFLITLRNVQGRCKIDFNEN